MHGLCETSTDTNALPDSVRKFLSKQSMDSFTEKILAKLNFDCDIAFKMTTYAKPSL